MSWPRRRPLVVFIDHTGWDCFLQLAAALRRAGGRPVCIRLDGDRWQSVVLRAGYGRTLRADSRWTRVRLARWARRARIVDLQLSEAAIAVLGRSSPIAQVLSDSAVPGGRRHWELIDKLEVSRRLAWAGVPVPPVRPVKEGAPPRAVADLAEQLGYPVVVKRRVEAAGQGVVIARDASAVLAAAKRFGTSGDGIFIEQFIDGDIVQYAAMVDSDGVVNGHEVCLTVEKPPDNPLGPSMAVTVIEDEQLLAAGRRAVSALGCSGLVNLEFVRDRGGTSHHIDLSMRSFGNASAISIAGIDLIGAYLRWLGLDGPVPRRGRLPRPATGTRLKVFPSAISRQDHFGPRWRVVWRLLSESGPYFRQFGLRYVAVAILLEMLRHDHGRRRTGWVFPEL